MGNLTVHRMEGQFSGSPPWQEINHTCWASRDQALLLKAWFTPEAIWWRGTYCFSTRLFPLQPGWDHIAHFTIILCQLQTPVKIWVKHKTWLVLKLADIDAPVHLLKSASGIQKGEGLWEGSCYLAAHFRPLHHRRPATMPVHLPFYVSLVDHAKPSS